MTASPHRPLDRDTTRSDERPTGAQLVVQTGGHDRDDDGHTIDSTVQSPVGDEGARVSAERLNLGSDATRGPGLGHEFTPQSRVGSRGATNAPRALPHSHDADAKQEGGPAFTATHAHRACLRALPSTLAGLGFGFAHILPVLTDAGLVDCRNGVYGRTPYGQHILDEHDAAIAAHAERSNALAQADKRLAAVRIAARANKLLEELKLIEADLHTLELRSTGMDAWRYRGAEVSAEHAQQLVWSVVCKLNGAGQ